LKPLSYITVEYCSKLDLFSYVAAGYTVGNEALCHAIFIQILHSVNFMHQTKGIAHLDIKLENIVLDSQYILKLIDFAYCEPKDTKMSKAKGTERYFAPEVAQIYYNRKVWHPENLLEQPTYVAEKADIFSLGILLFTLFFG